MLDRDFWTTLSVIAGGIRSFLTGVSKLIKVLKPEKKQLRKRQSRRFK